MAVTTDIVATYRGPAAVIRKQLAQGVRKPRGPRAEPEPELDSDSAPRFFNRVTGGLDSIWYTATDNALIAEARAKGLDRVRISDANIDGRVLRLYAPSLSWWRTNAELRIGPQRSAVSPKAIPVWDDPSQHRQRQHSLRRAGPGRPTSPLRLGGAGAVHSI